MKILIKIIILLVAMSVAIDSNSAVLTLPKEGAIFQSGDDIMVKVDVSEDEQISGILIATLRSRNRAIVLNNLIGANHPQAQCRDIFCHGRMVRSTVINL